MFEMWSLMDWRVYCYDKISQWKANLMAISNSRILWSKVMLQINSGGRPSLSRFNLRVFPAPLLQNKPEGWRIYLFIYPSIHTSTISIFLHTATVDHELHARQISELKCLQAQKHDLFQPYLQQSHSGDSTVLYVACWPPFFFSSI